MKRLLLLAASLFLAHPARAEAPAALCAAAKTDVRADTLLASEVAVVFGKADFTGTTGDCVYPLKALRYASADVLLVQWGEPGAGCHGCGATLSAYVIQRTGGGLKTVAKFREFTQLGSQGAIMEVWPIEIAGDDAMAIESGGTFQGYTSSELDFFAFHAGALVDLEPKPQVVLDADDEGATVDTSKTTVVREAGSSIRPTRPRSSSITGSMPRARRASSGSSGACRAASSCSRAAACRRR